MEALTYRTSAKPEGSVVATLPLSRGTGGENSGMLFMFGGLALAAAAVYFVRPDMDPTLPRILGVLGPLFIGAGFVVRQRAKRSVSVVRRDDGGELVFSDGLVLSFPLGQDRRRWKHSFKGTTRWWLFVTLQSLEGRSALLWAGGDDAGAPPADYRELAAQPPEEPDYCTTPDVLDRLGLYVEEINLDVPTA